MPDATRGVDGEPNDRAQQLLRTLVECYIRDGQPVGSRTLTRESGLSLSPATIRNVIADLEEHGFVSSPHTSAGRVPTDKGYRYFRRRAPALPAAGPGRDRRSCKRHFDDARQRPEGARRGGIAARVGPDAARRRRDGAARNPRLAVADRVRQPFRQPRADDPRRQWPRGTEPRRAARSPFLAGGVAARRRLTSTSCSPGRSSRACARASSRSCRRPASR